MTFTDDDLKRLKDHLAVHDDYDDDCQELPPVKIKALLARLEAAERVAELLSLSWEGESFELVKVWRKAAGK